MLEQGDDQLAVLIEGRRAPDDRHDAVGTSKGKQTFDVFVRHLLREETERELRVELGFETSALDRRVNLDLTYYSKTTKDALMQVAAAPSTGFVGNQLVNLGTISNSGVEAKLNLTLIQRRALNLETGISLATNSNELVSFGDGRAPIIFGSYAPSQRYQVGYPLGAMWAQRVKSRTE